MLCPLAFFLLFGCGVDHKPGSLSEWQEKVKAVSYDSSQVIPLQGKVVTDAGFLSIPRDAVPVGEYLVILDAKGDWLLHVIAARSGEHLGSWGLQGQGPAEFQSAWDYVTAAGDRQGLWIFDLIPQRLTYFDIRQFLAEQDIATPRIITLPVSRMGRAQQISATSEGLFATTGSFDSGRVRLFDAETNTVRSLGTALGGDEDIPVSTHQSAYHTKSG